MDFHKVLGEEILSVKLADSGLDAEDGLAGGGAEIEDTVVESGFEGNDDVLGVLAFFLVEDVLVLVALGVVHLEGEDGFGAGDDVEASDLQFQVFDGAGLDGFFDFF